MVDKYVNDGDDIMFDAGVGGLPVLSGDDGGGAVMAARASGGPDKVVVEEVVGPG